MSNPMFRAASIISAVWCLLVCGAIAYLHGFERASSGWNHRIELISVYSSEVVFRIGPCLLFAIAALVSGGIALWRTFLPIASGGLSLLCVVGTYFTIETYVKAQPGKLMATTGWDYVIGFNWLAAFVVCAGVLLSVLQNSHAISDARGDGRIR